jgi:RNA polymerase sigma-70 factor (ECF subfamily)
MTSIEFGEQLIEMEDRLNRFALSLTADKEDAKDLLQDTFLKALIYREQFEESTNLKAWIYTIMKNTFINYYRKNSRQNTTFDNTKDLFFLSQNKDTFNVEPDSAYREKEISRAIEQLDGEFKVPFQMHIQGYKYKEIADILGLKIGTVKSRIFFTRKKLSDSLCDYSTE